MKGNEIASRLPAKHGSAREEMILDFVRQGHVVVRWTPVSLFRDGKKYTFYVTAEPLMLGETWEDGFYPGMSAITMQKIADLFNSSLLTPKLVDEIWNDADFRIDPIISFPGIQAAGLPKSGTMVDIATMVIHSQLVKKRIDDARKKAGKFPPLIANIGKYWVVNSQTSQRQKSRENKNADAGINYGWHRAAKGVSGRTATGQPNTDIWQPPGYEHPLSHSDYSQLCMLVSRAVRVCEPAALSGLGADLFYKCKDGKKCKVKGLPGRTRCMDIYDLAQDKTLAKLVSHEGTINMRIPSVPWEKPSSCPLIDLAEGRTEEGIAGVDGPLTPYAMMGVAGFRSFGEEDLCTKPPPAPTTIGKGNPSLVTAPAAGDIKRYAVYGAIGLAGAAALYLALQPRS